MMMGVMMRSALISRYFFHYKNGTKQPLNFTVKTNKKVENLKKSKTAKLFAGITSIFLFKSMYLSKFLTVPLLYQLLNGSITKVFSLVLSG